MFKIFYTLAAYPSNFFKYLGLFALFLLPIIIFIDVVLRFMGYGLYGSIEIQTNLLVFITFALLAHLQLHKNHMCIDFIYIKLSPSIQKICDIIINLLSFFLLLLLCYQAIETYFSRQGFLSDEIGIKVAYYYLIPCIGLALTLCISLVQLFENIVNLIKDKAFIPFLIGLLISICIVFFPYVYKVLELGFSNFVLGGLVFLIMFFLLFCKMPVSFAMILAGFIGLIIARNDIVALTYLGNTSYSAVAQHAFIALPMFTLMGGLILFSGISADLFSCASKWIGHKAGGLGMASIMGCTGFAAISGDSMSTAVTMGSVALPEMKKYNYDPALATGALAAGGTLGILLPPSAALIIYGVITETSINSLFIAGIIPGLFLAILFMLYIYYIAKKYPQKAPLGKIYSQKEKSASLKGIFPMLALLILVLGGIMGGFFSPTEGGGIGAVGAFVFALARHKLNLKNLISALEQAALLTAKLMTIMIGVGLVSYFFASTRLPFIIADFVTSLPIHRMCILAIIIAMFIALGCVMNLIPMLTLLLPSIFPSIIALGFDPIWFGIICVIVIEMGQISPPVGLVVFALANVDKSIPIITIFKGIFPFLGVMLLSIVILTIFPSMVTFLPSI